MTQHMPPERPGRTTSGEWFIIAAIVVMSFSGAALLILAVDLLFQLPLPCGIQ